MPAPTRRFGPWAQPFRRGGDALTRLAPRIYQRTVTALPQTASGNFLGVGCTDKHRCHLLPQEMDHSSSFGIISL